MTTLEQLKGIAVKSEELRLSGLRTEGIQCILVIPIKAKDETWTLLGCSDKTSWPVSINSRRYGELPLTVLEIDDVDRVGITRKKTYKAMLRKLSDPHPEAITAAQRQIAKSEKGILPGVPRTVLEEKLQSAQKDTLKRRVILAISRLKSEDQGIAFDVLKKSDSVLITNWFDAPYNLWLGICTKSGSINQRAKNGVTLIFSAEKHERSDSKVASLCINALMYGGVVGQYILFSDKD